MHSASEVNKAIGILYAHASVVNGELVPHWLESERETGIARRTLERWWEKRDRRDDAQFRAIATRAKQEAAELGGAAWVRKSWLRIAEISDIVLDPDAYREGGRYASLDSDKVARGLKLMSDTLPAVERALAGTETSHESPAQRIRRVEQVARGAGLLNKKPKAKVPK